MNQIYARLVSMVTSRDFLARLESLRQALSNGTQNQFPFKEPTGIIMWTRGSMYEL